MKKSKIYVGKTKNKKFGRMQREASQEGKKKNERVAKWKSEIREILSSSTDYIFTRKKARIEAKFIY